MELKDIRTKYDLGDEEGRVTAVYSTLDVVDHGGDIVLRSALPYGKPVPMYWAHDVKMPVGRGIATTTETEGIFDGRFTLGSSWGRDAYESVKDQAELMEWSWSFEILDAADEVRDGKSVRVIKATDLREVSPVQRGEGLFTRTLGIKSQNLTFADELEALLADAERTRDRGMALAAMRALEGRKSGRAVSRANWERMKAVLDTLAAFVEEHDPDREADDPEKAARIREGRREQLRYLTNRARQMATLGV